MPQRDTIHNIIRQALIKEGWEITDAPYVISYGERFFFIDLAARLDALNGIAGRFIGARRGSSRIAIDPDRELYLAIVNTTFDEI
jgi:hypothetical protein